MRDWETLRKFRTRKFEPYFIPSDPAKLAVNSISLPIGIRLVVDLPCGDLKILLYNWHLFNYSEIVINTAGTRTSGYLLDRGGGNTRRGIIVAPT